MSEPRRYGRLTRGELSHIKGSARYYHFTCDCGTKAVYPMSSVYGGKTNCGCVRDENALKDRIRGNYAKLNWQDISLQWRRKQEEKHFCSCKTDEHTGRFKVIDGKEVEIMVKPRELTRDFFLIDPALPPNEDNCIYVPTACIGHGVTYHNVLLMLVHRVPIKDIAFALDVCFDKIADMEEQIRQSFNTKDLAFLNGECRLSALTFDEQSIARVVFVDESDNT